jgi:hypothetical protein
MNDYQFPRCQVVPEAGHQASMRIDGAERLRWHFGTDYPRPFLYPLNGPSGRPLTRMGHPGAPNHDHHQSIWFAHQKVLGIDFWSNNTPARVRQKEWLAYQDGDDEALLAVRLGWFDGHDPKELLVQDLIVAIRPGPEGETFVELQSTFTPAAASLEFGKTNFGFLAVRVAKSISEYFGGGRLTNSDGLTGEPAIFGKPAAWMDYSGPVRTGDAGAVVEGVTFFDHPANPGHPAHWHVREDGWMGASVCLNGPIETTRDKPLVLRYLLHAHRGVAEAARCAETLRTFASTGPYVVSRATVKHVQYAVNRAAAPAG